MMFHNYEKIEMDIMTKKIIDTVDRFKRSSYINWVFQKERTKMIYK